MTEVFGRGRRDVGLLCAVGCIVLSQPSGPLAGQRPDGASRSQSDAWTAPRTPWGDPDLQGIYTSNSNSDVPVERPERYGLRKLLTDEEYAEREQQTDRLRRDDKAERSALRPGNTGAGPEHWYERSGSSRRTSLVVDPPDGQIPLTAEMVQLFEDRNASRQFGIGLDSWVEADLWDRCITKGPGPTSMIWLGYDNAYQILQVPGYVVILFEIMHETRIIPLDGPPHVSDSLRQWWGDSRGHWEGHTLVVEMTNFTEKLRGYQQPMGRYRGGGASQHLVERFTRTDAGTLLYSVTLTDPESFTRPWAMEIPLTRDDTYQMYEYACHEGNYGISHMLSGARAVEKAEAVSGH